MTREQWAELSPEEQSKSVLKCLGFEEDKYIGFIINKHLTKPFEDIGFLLVPDYLNDLNAMHEAEKHIPDSLWNQYCDLLERLSKEGESIHATASEKAEAFVLTMEENDR